MEGIWGPSLRATRAAASRRKAKTRSLRLPIHTSKYKSHIRVRECETLIRGFSVSPASRRLFREVDPGAIQRSDADWGVNWEINPNAHSAKSRRSQNLRAQLLCALSRPPPKRALRLECEQITRANYLGNADSLISDTVADSRRLFASQFSEMQTAASRRLLNWRLV